MFHDKITTHAGGKAGPAGIRRTALAPDAISRVPAGRPARARPLASCGPDEVPWIVRRWLRCHPQTQTSCAPMPSMPPPEGPMTFRPCSDARADKTDLHAYDGDRPKLSHRTERRLRAHYLRRRPSLSITPPLGGNPGRTGLTMPVPIRNVPPCRAALPAEGHCRGPEPPRPHLRADSTSDTPPDNRPRPPWSCYLIP